VAEVVLDASVAFKWFAADEPDTEAARRLLDAFGAGEVDLLAPDVWLYEVANAALVAVRRGRLTPDEAWELVRALMEVGVDLRDVSALCESAWSLAVAHERSIYDAAYLALARERRCDFYTADKRMVQSLGAMQPVKWVGDFE
jgi:predicted nucleic acid-binding protein